MSTYQARPLRIEFSGALYHLTARGNAQQAIFIEEDDRSELRWSVQPKTGLGAVTGPQPG